MLPWIGLFIAKRVVRTVISAKVQNADDSETTRSECALCEGIIHPWHGEREVAFENRKRAIARQAEYGMLAYQLINGRKLRDFKALRKQILIRKSGVSVRSRNGATRQRGRAQHR
jgi:hypothetical protein